MTTAITITTPEGIERFRLITIRRAILMWVDCGIKANRAYTPKAMAAAASAVTEKAYTTSKPSLRKAADDLAAILGIEQ